MKTLSRILLFTLIAILLTPTDAAAASSLSFRRARSAETIPAVASYLHDVKVKASSTLSGGNYGAENLFDGDLSTAWVEGASGGGLGESVTLSFEKGMVITQLHIWPGYYKSEKLYFANAAPSRILVSGGDTEYSFDLSDCAASFKNRFVILDLPKPLPLPDGKLTVSIEAVREGTKYEDTCISELQAYGLWGDSEAAAALKQGKKLRVITENAMFNLCHEARWLYLWESGNKPKDTYSGKLSNADNLTKARILYWYQYSISDPRIRDSEDLIFHLMDEGDVVDLYKELFGEDMDESEWQTILNEFVEEWDNNGLYFMATGDFGDAPLFPDPDPVMEIRGGQVVLSGSLMDYDPEKEEYVPSYTYTAYCTEGGPQTMGGLRVERVAVRKR